MPTNENCDEVSVIDIGPAHKGSQKGWLEKKVEELQERVKELAKAGSAKAPRAPRRAALKRTTLR